MPDTAPTALAGRFALIMDGLCQALRNRTIPMGVAGPLLVLIWNRFRRYARHFTSLVNRGSATPRSRSPSVTPERPSRPPPPVQTPRDYAWLLSLVPQTAHPRNQLRELLAEPEMMALLEANPGLRRILRPLCRMLGIPPTPATSPPAPPPKSAATPEPPPIPPPAPDTQENNRFDATGHALSQGSPNQADFFHASPSPPALLPGFSQNAA